MTEWKYRGRQVSSEDILYIRELIAADPRQSRRALSKKRCEAWQWRQPNGELRDMVCRGLLLMLDRAGAIRLPPVHYVRHNPLASRARPAPVLIDTTPIQGTSAGLSTATTPAPLPGPQRRESRNGRGNASATGSASKSENRLRKRRFQKPRGSSLRNVFDGCCDRPGCYECFVRSRRSPRQRFCSHACRRALERVWERERRWRRRRGRVPHLRRARPRARQP
jgi:hypothetical protein